MKKFIYILPVVLMALSSCSGDSGKSLLEMTEYFPFKERYEDKWGFIGRNGEVLIENEFKNQPSPVVNGIFYVEENNGYVLYKAGKKPEMIKGCDDLEEVGFYVDGVIPVSRKKQRITLVNKNGETVATLNPIKNKEIVKSAGIFSEGMLAIEDEDGKVGYVNTKGEVVIQPKYEEGAPFNEGLALVVKKGNDKWKVVAINKKGEEVFSMKESYRPLTQIFQYGYLPVRDDDRYGFINKKGEFFRLSTKVDGLGNYNSKYFVFEEDYKSGVMTLNPDEQEIIVKAKYDAIMALNDNKFLAYDDGDFLVLNNKGEKEFEFDDDYKDVAPFLGTKFTYVAEDKNGYYSLLGKDGKPINKLEFKYFKALKEPMTIYSHYSKDRQEGVEVVEADWDVPVEEVVAEPDYDEEYLGDLDSENMYDWLLTREATDSDLRGVPKSELRIMRNWIFARHGYIFQSEDLQQYFGRFSWYYPQYKDVNSQLSPTELTNIAKIKQYE